MLNRKSAEWVKRLLSRMVFGDLQSVRGGRLALSHRVRRTSVDDSLLADLATSRHVITRSLLIIPPPRAKFTGEFQENANCPKRRRGKRLGQNEAAKVASNLART